MRIARAYCVEAGTVVDIYQARALFFAQEEPRRRFEFLCSDDACRGVTPTRVTGVNYDKLVEGERDRIIVKPHFRMNPDTPHSATCEWVARERALEAADSPEPVLETRGRTNGFRHLKSSDLVDVFVPRCLTLSLVDQPLRSAPLSREPSDPGHDETRHQRCGPSPTRADLVEAVVTVYELLEPEERREAVLRIGRGPRLPYSRAFCRVEHYFSARGARIFHGGVSVQPHGPNFAVRFFDRVARIGEAAKGNPRTVSLYLKREALVTHWNGKFLLALLTEASKRGHYAHCYFYGRLVDHPKVKELLVVEVESLEHLAFTVRERAPADRCAVGNQV